MPNLTNKRSSSNKFRCLHCPFTGCSRDSLRQHEFHHSAGLPLQCPFCTFSVSHKIAMTRHMNRVHPEEAAAKKKKKLLRMKKRKIRDYPPSIIATTPSLYVKDRLIAKKEGLFIEKGARQEEDRQDAINNPRRHMMKIIKAIASFSQVYKEKAKSRPISPISCENHNLTRQISDDHSTKTALKMVDQNLNEAFKKEEMQCHKELDQLAKEIKVCRVEIDKASKEMEPEEEKLRQRMKILETTEQGLSAELAALLEQKKEIKEEETEKTELIMKIDRELFLLKLNLEASGDSSPSLKNERNEKRINKKEKLVIKVKKKLKRMGREVRDLDEQIRKIERKLEENDKNLVELRKDIESLGSLPAAASTSDSSNNVRIETLKSEVRERIIRFAYLEQHLILLNAKHVIDDIRRKKKEWLDSFDCEGDDDDDDEEA